MSVNRSCALQGAVVPLARDFTSRPAHRRRAGLLGRAGRALVRFRQMIVGHGHGRTRPPLVHETRTEACRPDERQEGHGRSGDGDEVPGEHSPGEDGQSAE